MSNLFSITFHTNNISINITVNDAILHNIGYIRVLIEDMGLKDNITINLPENISAEAINMIGMILQQNGAYQYLLRCDMNILLEILEVSDILLYDELCEYVGKTIAQKLS